MRIPTLVVTRSSIASVALLSLVIAAPDCSAVVLTFDQAFESGVIVPLGVGGEEPPTYGDRVRGTLQHVAGGVLTYGEAGEGFTPNVVVDFFSQGPGNTSDVKLFGANYGDLTNVMYGNESAGSLNLYFTADDGYEVLLYGFDLAGWPQQDYTINAVRVTDGNSLLFEQTSVLVEGDDSGPGHTAFIFDTPLSAAYLAITIDVANIAGRSQDNIGIDNVRFGQSPPAPVPVPAALPLLAGAIALLAGGDARRRRRGVRPSVSLG
ncbi:MAG: hypothetical protein H6978_04600 [Gammaproteobacteria bacterium]|nr:hypothetical protein [Gammaproteobacteria bacterium]